MAKDTKKKESEKTQAPVKKFRAGNVTATVWKNTKEINKKKIDFFNVTIERSYTTEDEEWKTTSSFGREDLIKVMIVTQKASEYIYLKEYSEEDEDEDE